MTENRAISKAETTGMTLEDVLGKRSNLDCPNDEMPKKCGHHGNCYWEICNKCHADFIRNNWEKLK